MRPAHPNQSHVPPQNKVPFSFHQFQNYNIAFATSYMIQSVAKGVTEMEQYAMYLRKSRFDRDYAELSVEETLRRHKAILDRTAKERRYYIAQIYYEVVSGESIAARPEIQKLLEAVGNELYAGVLVVDLERLARGNSADQAYISQVFQFSSTKIITPAKTYDPNNEYDEDFFEFGLFMSRREYKTINRRLIRGRDSSASEGKYISSIAPYGYQKKNWKTKRALLWNLIRKKPMLLKKFFRCSYSTTEPRRLPIILTIRKSPPVMVISGHTRQSPTSSRILFMQGKFGVVGASK